MTIAQCVSGQTSALYKMLRGEEFVITDCGESLHYVPDPTACLISAATSYYHADQILNDQLCTLLDMWVSGTTPTNTSYWLKEGANRKLQVDTRLSHGRYADMVDDNMYIHNLDGDYIDPTNNEFTDTNALRIVCLTESPGGVIPDIKSKQNGIYLSNVWDCGLYYGPADTEAKAAAAAAGYNTNYETDEAQGASAYNYMNNVRRGSDTLC
jgi:hypothetical protein